MSKEQKNSQGGGFGLGTAVLLGAGAAAVGFLAGNWLSTNLEQSSSSSSNHRRPSTASDWERKTDNMARKKQRESFKTQGGDGNIPDEMKCVVCLENPREICIIPCGHVCLCEDCSEKIDKKCPMCQQIIKNKKAIYI